MRELLFALVLALPSAAMAFHPLVGEDTLFLGKDVRRLEAGMQYGVSRTGPARYSTGVYAELCYGLFDDLDVLITVPWHGWSSSGISKSGLGDVQLETKFPVARKAGWTLALKPGFSLPAGSEADSLGAGKGGVWLYSLAGRAAGPWQFYLNAGYMYNRNSLDERVDLLKASASAVYALAPGLQATAELAAGTNPDKSSLSTPVSAILGTAWSPYPTLSLNAGAGFGLTWAADDLVLIGGFTLRL